MKTLIISLLLTLSVALSSVSFAQDINGPVNTPDVTGKTQTVVRPANNGKFEVVAGETDGSLLIQVVDQHGRTLSRKPVYKQDSNTRIRFGLTSMSFPMASTK